MKLRSCVTALAILTTLACGDDAGGPVVAGHETVHGVAFYVEGELVDRDPKPLGSSGDCYELRFLDEDGDWIRGLQSYDVASITFSPAGFASADQDAAEAGFYFDIGVPGQPGGVGTVTVSLSHGDPAQHQTFGPFDVILVAEGRDC